jgi:hypothetical protein
MPKIKHSDLKTRDELLVRIIQGATKAGVQKDQKKETSKKKCRKPIREDE